MATKGANITTLADVAKTMDPDGRPARVIELLNQTNRVMDDAHWMEGNLPGGHQTTVRTGLPTSFWRLANQGLSTSKSTEAQFTEQCGMLEQWSSVDKDVCELNGNTAAYRLSRARAGLESMNQEMVQTMFYGNTGTAPEEFLGLAVRYNSTSAGNGSNVIKAGGSGSDNSSIWLIGWGPDTVFCMYPKGSQAGILHEDLGLQTITTTAGAAPSLMRGYQDHWQWKCGIAVADWRFAVRICNIDISDLIANTSPADLTNAMIKALHRIPFPEMVKLGFYMNRTCFEMLDIQRKDAVKSGGQLTYQVVDGLLIPHFRNVPIRIVDQLVENEATVS